MWSKTMILISWLFWAAPVTAADTAEEEPINRHHLRSSSLLSSNEQQQPRELQKATLPGGGTTLRAKMTLDSSDVPIFFHLPIEDTPLESETRLEVCDALPWRPRNNCLDYVKSGEIQSSQQIQVKQVPYGSPEGSLYDIQPYRARFTTDSRSSTPILKVPFYGVPYGALESSDTLMVCDHESLSGGSLGNCLEYTKD